MESLKLNTMEELHVLLFLHFHGVLNKIYFFKGCEEVLKTWFCFKELHKVNFWNSHGVLPTRFLLKNSIIPFLHCNGVLHEANYLEGYGVLKDWTVFSTLYFLRATYVIFYANQNVDNLKTPFRGNPGKWKILNYECTICTIVTL